MLPAAGGAVPPQQGEGPPRPALGTFTPMKGEEIPKEKNAPSSNWLRYGLLNGRLLRLDDQPFVM